MKNSKKKISGGRGRGMGGRGSGEWGRVRGGVRMDVNEEVKFL